MIKQPLFGQDSSPHQTSMFLSAIITLIGWIIFCVLSLVIKIKPQTPQYKEVQIVLSSTPTADPEPVEATESAASEDLAVVEESPAVVEPVETTTPELPNPVETPVAEAKVEAPKETPAPAKPQTQPKTQTQPAKTTTPAPKTTDPSKTVDFDNMTYATDYSDFSFNNSSASSNKTWDESKFSNDSSSTSSDNTQPKKVNVKSDFEGNQGTATNSPNNPVRSSDNKTQKNNTTSTLSDTDLNKIRNAVVAKGSGKNGIETSLSANTSSSDSKTITMSDGSTRKIIKSSPINLSEEASKTIDFNEMKLKITFRVLTNGNVLPSSIKIDKAIFLDDIVVQEINNQIKLWILAPADSEAIAIFELTIKKQ